MITRLPGVTREGTARLWVFHSQGYQSGGTPTTPRCLTRASGLTDHCCGCRRHDALVKHPSSSPIEALVHQLYNVIGYIYCGRRWTHSDCGRYAIDADRGEDHLSWPQMNGLGRTGERHKTSDVDRGARS
ncbi:hypothetical protein LSAT2_028710 [Lamellibrachia satsuma]|nr:hypothetical protein LSAT2_028710 [Lamellibrachia satsuma]